MKNKLKYGRLEVLECLGVHFACLGVRLGRLEQPLERLGVHLNTSAFCCRFHNKAARTPRPSQECLGVHPYIDHLRSTGTPRRSLGLYMHLSPISTLHFTRNSLFSHPISRISLLQPKTHQFTHSTCSYHHFLTQTIKT